MYGYDLSSRSRTLNSGRYWRMKRCSVRSASASVCVATKSIWSIWSIMSTAPRVPGLEKCEATRLRIERALPT